MGDSEYPKPIAAVAAGGTGESVRRAPSLWKYHSRWFLFPGTRNLIHAIYKSGEGLDGEKDEVEMECHYGWALAARAKGSAFLSSRASDPVLRNYYVWA